MENSIVTKENLVNVSTKWYFEIISFNFKLVNNGFEEFIVDGKETCDNKFKIGLPPIIGEDTCRERCRSDPECNYYFYTFKETCDDKEWCALYKDCGERRIPLCNGRTFRKTGTPTVPVPVTGTLNSFIRWNNLFILRQKLIQSFWVHVFI